MFFTITHTTRYTYDQPVLLEPHLVRLRPRSDWNQQLHHFELTVDPAPLHRAQNLELDGNAALLLRFAGPCDHLELRVHSTVETLCANPFTFLLDPASGSLPLGYEKDLARLLAPYCRPQVEEETVVQFAQDLAHQAGGQTLPFLSALNQRIYTVCAGELRPEGDPLPAAQTLTRGQGACRDLALLFMDSCRALGLAARFVSGYHAGTEAQEERYLHAWAEVYLPGGGWRGYDPSQGLAVADRHVALAAGPTPAEARPLVGSFRGSGASSRMSVQMDILTSASLPQNAIPPSHSSPRSP